VKLAEDCLKRGETHYGILAVVNQWGPQGHYRAVAAFLERRKVEGDSLEPPINQVIYLELPDQD